MVMDQPFTTASSVIATYNYEDIINGLGIVYFYAVSYTDSTGINKFLSSENVGMTGEEFAAGTFNVDASQFNFSRTAAGIATITGTTNVAGANVTITAKLQHWDGSTATDITSAISSGTVTKGETFILRLPITETKFNIGESLRLNVIMSANGVLCQTDTPFIIRVPFKTNR